MWRSFIGSILVLISFGLQTGVWSILRQSILVFFIAIAAICSVCCCAMVLQVGWWWQTTLPCSFQLIHVMFSTYNGLKSHSGSSYNGLWIVPWRTQCVVFSAFSCYPVMIIMSLLLFTCELFSHKLHWNWTQFIKRIMVDLFH